MSEITTEAMTEADFRLLELLLCKLATQLGNKICIIPGHIQDGYHIGVYDRKTGDIKASATSPTIKETVYKLKEQQP